MTGEPRESLMPTLTDVTVRSLKPPESGQRTYVCDSLPGFGCRVSQGGAKTFVLLYGQDRQRITLGRYPIISLADARDTAKRLLAERTLGKFRPKSVKWQEALDEFLAAVAERNKPRTHASYARLLNRHFNFGTKRLAEITPDDITRRLDALAEVPSERNHALTVVKVFLRWAMKPPRRYLPHSPCEGMTISKRPSRKRSLTDREIVILWNATDEDEIFHKIVRLCILTGQRRGEIGALRAEYIDWNRRAITLPDTKNGRPHTFPFGPMAEKILKTLPKEGYLFPGRYTSEQPYNGWAKGKRELDAKYGNKIVPYTLHDLRRTFATNLAALGTPPHITERLLNHVSGTISGVAEIYNRYAYMDEMRVAVRAWEKRLGALLRA